MSLSYILRFYTGASVKLMQYFREVVDCNHRITLQSVASITVSISVEGKESMGQFKSSQHQSQQQSQHPFRSGQHQSGWTRRQALWLMAGAVGGVSLHACAQPTTTSSAIDSPTSESAASPSATASSPIVASFGITTWVGNTALYIAKEKGFFQNAGLNLDLKKFATIADGFPSFTTGQIQGTSPVTAEVVSLAAKGTNYRVVAVMDTSVGADAILARNSVASIADFKGKQVGVQKGGVGHFFLLQVLAESGLKESDVTIVDVAPDAAAAAYQAGKIDIVYSYSPFVEEANTAQKDGRIIYDTSKMPTAIMDLYAFKTDFIQNNPQAVKAFVGGVFQALDFLQSNPDEALPIAAEPLGVKPEELQTQLKGVKLPDLKTNVEMLSNAQSDLYVLKPMTALAAFLKEQGQIETEPDLSQFIDPQFVQALSST